MTSGGPVDRNRPPRPEMPAPPPPRRRPGREREGIGEAAIKSILRSVGASIGRALVRMLTGGRRR
jgi:hypothetical protein